MRKIKLISIILLFSILINSIAQKELFAATSTEMLSTIVTCQTTVFNYSTMSVVAMKMMNKFLSSHFTETSKTSKANKENSNKKNTPNTSETSIISSTSNELKKAESDTFIKINRQVTLNFVNNIKIYLSRMFLRSSSQAGLLLLILIGLLIHRGTIDAYSTLKYITVKTQSVFRLGFFIGGLNV